MRKYFPGKSTNAILENPSGNENVSEEIRILCQRNTNDAFQNEGAGGSDAWSRCGRYSHCKRENI
jgi:hypothetical protein